MKELLLAAVICGVLFQGVHASLCLQYTYSYYTNSYYSTYIFCDYGCCGTSYTRFCCSGSYSSTYTYTSSSWSAAAIAGVVCGSIFGLSILITIIVAIIKACTKSGSNGRVVKPSQYPAQNKMFVVSSGAHSTAQQYPAPLPGMPPPPHTGMHPPPQPGIAPPPYGGPVVEYPPPPSLYSAPGQPVSQPTGPGTTG